jgi:hypothetical protein
MINRIKQFFRDTPNSVLFWNGLVLLSLITIGIINLDLLGVTLGILSIFSFAVLIGANESEIENNLWLYFTPPVWFTLIIVLIGFLLYKFYKKVIEPFNRWLNKNKN